MSNQVIDLLLKLRQAALKEAFRYWFHITKRIVT